MPIPGENHHWLQLHRYFYQQQFSVTVGLDRDGINIVNSESVTAVQGLATDGNVAAKHERIDSVSFQLRV